MAMRLRYGEWVYMKQWAARLLYHNKWAFPVLNGPREA